VVNECSRVQAILAGKIEQERQLSNLSDLMEWRIRAALKILLRAMDYERYVLVYREYDYT
jgi:hypothetical protein